MKSDELSLFSKKLLELLKEFKEIEIDNVEISTDELTLIVQPIVQAIKPIETISMPSPLKLPEELIKTEFVPPIEAYQGYVVEVKIGATKSEGGSRGKVIKIGGSKTLPFYSFEQINPNKPVFAMDVFDMPLTLPKPVKQHFQEVMEDPAEWAKKCVEDYHADMVSLNLISTDPSIKDTSPKEASKVVEKVLQAVDVPIVIGGSGNKQKDPLVLEAAAEVAHGERCILNSVSSDMDYKRVVKAAKEHGHIVISFTPMDINNQKKLNRLLLDEGLPKEQIIMDPTTGALGYGIEYSISLLERIRLGALLGDPELQMPVLSASSNAWGAREAWVKSEELGPREYRGPLWETVTALTMLFSGAEIFMISHPATLAVLKQIVKDLYGESEVESEQKPIDWIIGVK
jgi:acetyl-CoA decarbonylase/synthase complex subunit delta